MGGGSVLDDRGGDRSPKVATAQHRVVPPSVLVYSKFTTKRISI